MKKKNKTFRLLCLFDYNASTGFATVSHNLMKRLERYFEDRMYADIIAINYFGDAYKTARTNVLPASIVDKKQDIYGRNEFLNMLNLIDYDAIFMINDLGVINPMIPILRDIKDKKKKKFKSIFYFPVDAPYLHHEFEELDFYDVLIPYTRYAKEQVLEVKPALKTKMRTILHGVNTNDFMQVSSEDRSEFRKAYFGEDNADRYIIGNINRNQPRKDIPATIFAFNHHRKTYDELYPDKALLYLHMNPKDEMGYNLRSICTQLGLKENVDYMFPPQELIDKQPEAKYLCMIYNALDIFVTTTTGEGFGLTVLEAMQCGVPVIAPYHTALRELYPGHIHNGYNYFAIMEMQLMAQHYDSMVRYSVDPKDVSEYIQRVRSDPGGLNVAKVVASAKVFAANLNWDIIAKAWIEEFKKIV